MSLKVAYPGGHKIWVINKQAPNKQIWWSSPISGPLRFEYSGGGLADGWLPTSGEKIGMLTLLRKELLSTTGIDILDILE